MTTGDRKWLQRRPQMTAEDSVEDRRVYRRTDRISSTVVGSLAPSARSPDGVAYLYYHKCWSILRCFTWDFKCTLDFVHCWLSVWVIHERAHGWGCEYRKAPAWTQIESRVVGSLTHNVNCFCLVKRVETKKTRRNPTSFLAWPTK